MDQGQPTDDDIREAIEECFHDRDSRRPGWTPAQSLDNAVTDWWGAVFDSDSGLWRRWPCDDEKCPALPPYDSAISTLYNELEAVTEACADLIRERLAGMAARIRAEYPDAPRPIVASESGG